MADIRGPSNSKNGKKAPAEASWATVLFAGELAPYRPPSNPVARALFNWRLCLEATFVFTLLEPWEKGLLRALSLSLSGER